MSLMELKNLSGTMEHDAKMALAAKLLESASQQAQNQIVPLGTDYAAYKRRQEEEQRKMIICALVLAGVSLSVAVVIAFRMGRKIKDEVEKEVRKIHF